MDTRNDSHEWQIANAGASPGSSTPAGWGSLSGDEILRRTHKRTNDAIDSAIDADDARVVDAPPGAGKTTMCFQIARKNGVSMTYLAARKDLYEQAADLAKDAGYADHEIKVSPAPHRDCPSFTGEHGGDTKERVTRLYNLGYSAPNLHESSRLDLPCHTESDPCPYMVKRDFDPDDYEVIIGYYYLAYEDDYIRDRVVFIDEFAKDAFETVFSRDEEDAMAPDRAINPYLDHVSAIPFDNYGDLIANRDDLSKVGEALAYLKDPWHQEPRKSEMVDQDEDEQYHLDAPYLVWSLLYAEQCPNGIEPNPLASDPDGVFTESRQFVRIPGTSIDHDSLYVFEPASLDAAASVVALDGTPVMELWNTIFQDTFTRESVLTEAETREYVSRGQGIRVEQIEDAGMKPYSSGDSVSPHLDAAITMGMAINSGRSPDVITTKAAMDEYQATVPEMYDFTSRTVNYSKVPSSNELAGRELNLIHGSLHPGDNEIKKWGLYAGEVIDRATDEDGEPLRGVDITYEPELGQKIYESYVHEMVGQAIMRVRSDGDDPADATVVVNTAAIPDWIEVDVLIEVPRDYPLRSEKKRELAIVMMEADGVMTQDELDDELDYHRKRIGKTLNDFAEEGWVDDSWNSDGAKEYEWVA